MAISKRIKTGYPGVFYRISKKIGSNEDDKIYYIVFKKDGKVIEEKVGRQSVDDITPSKVSGIRAKRIEGELISRKEKKTLEQARRNKPTISRLWEIYREDKVENTSLKIEISRFDAHLRKPFGHKLSSEIVTNDIRLLRGKLSREGKSPQTIRNILALLRRIIRFGAKNGLCEMPPLIQLYFEMPKTDNVRTEFLTPSQLAALKEALDAEIDQEAVAALRLALVTGIRKSAIFALEWSDIDFEAGFITLRGDSAKKAKTDRVPLPEIARAILTSIVRIDEKYIFPGKSGGHRRDMSRIARRVRKNAGLPDDFRPFHGLRHTYASILASSGQVDLYTLQKLLTHSSPQMTQRYAHLADEALKKAARVSDALFGD